jgi:HRDC domain-containing protein
VFDRETLVRLAIRPPLDAAALAEMPGVGPLLTERYGATLLAALRYSP